jgi:transposase
VTEQRYKAVLAVIGDGRTVSEVATDWGVSRRTLHRWLARYEGDGLEGLKDRSHRPAQSPHQMPPAVEARVLEMRRSHPYWGARRIAFELARKRVELAPSESAVYPLPGPSCGHRPHQPTAASGNLEALGAGGADGALAAGPSAWLSPG